jgi:uncharacterized protein (DUF2141 family)
MNMKLGICLLAIVGVLAVVCPVRAILGDVNGDGKVDMKDIAIVAAAFGSTPSSPRWDPRADVNGDGKVNMLDVAIVASNFGK